MFLRAKKRIKDGKEHRHWSVVENRRVSGGKTIQRQVLYLGEIGGGPDAAKWWDKVPSKFAGWGPNRFREAGFRAVPGAIASLNCGRSSWAKRNRVSASSRNINRWILR